MSVEPKSSSGEHLRVPPHVKTRQFDDELVILDLERGTYFSLSATGAKMWHALASGETPTQIAASLVTEYQVEQDVLLHDCLRLVDELLSRGLLERVGM